MCLVGGIKVIHFHVMLTTVNSKVRMAVKQLFHLFPFPRVCVSVCVSELVIFVWFVIGLGANACPGSTHPPQAQPNRAFEDAVWPR